MEEIVVAKFGGSSLADSKQFLKVKNIVQADSRRRFVVPSAPGRRHPKDHKITDLLYLCHQHAEQHLPFDDIFQLITNRYTQICIELGVILDIEGALAHIKKCLEEGTTVHYTASRGEYLNGLILASLLDYQFIDAAELIVFDESGHFDSEATQVKVEARLKNVDRAVIPGFYGATEAGEIRAFSRGGSDITGAIIARGVFAKCYENWTDVSGFFIADPRVIENPRHIEKVTYKELRELSYMGASVLHEEAIFPVVKANIPIQIKNTNAPQDEGTLIVSDLEPVKYLKTITGIAGKKDFTVITIDKMLMSNEVGFLRKLLSIIESYQISIEHMPSSIDTVSVVISNQELGNKLEDLVADIRLQIEPDIIAVHPNMALIAVVGRGMISTKGISARVFASLAQEGINVRMISQGSSEMNIIVGIENEDFEAGIQALYKAFEALVE